MARPRLGRTGGWKGTAALNTQAPAPVRRTDESNSTLEGLLAALDELVRASDMAGVHKIVCRAARELTSADGAAYVLRDGKQCFFAEEDAISPVWKGRSFPIGECIGGWVIVYRQAVVISDVSLDERLNPSSYDPTFVKSMAMVPIRSTSPVGAVGVYWDRIHTPSMAEISALQALADATAVTLESVSLNAYALDDSLTGLYNRRGFFSRGAERLSSNRDRGLGTAVVFAALDGIGEINRLQGHEAGDEAIRRIGAALRSVCGPEVVIGRIAGSDFAVCGSIDALPTTDPAELERAVEDATPESGRPVGLTVGIATASDGEQHDLDSLVALANRNMYQRRHGHLPPTGDQVARTATRP